MISLFDDIDRTCTDIPSRTELQFVYLNRSARQAADTIRRVLEDWFSRYPDDEKHSLRKQFRANDIGHHSAFFELMLHELLLRQGCSVSIHHDPGTGKSTRPDFLVTAPDGQKFFMEAILATVRSDKERDAETRANVVYEAIERLDSPNFFIGIEVLGAPTGQPRGREIRQLLKKKLKALDPDDIAKLWEKGKDQVPHWSYSNHGWEIVFYPIPKGTEHRGKPGVRSIGVHFTPMHQINTEKGLRKAVENKAGKYGQFGLPFVIAVNALEHFASVEDCDDALLGDECLCTRLNESTMDHDAWSCREPNGVFGTANTPSSKRVSGVLFAFRATPWGIGSAKSVFHHHPWAEKPVESIFSNLNQVKATSLFGATCTVGHTLRELLGLHENWLDEPDSD